MISRALGRLRRLSVAASKDVMRGSAVMAAWPWRNEAARNWGDLLNPYLVEWLSGKACVPYDQVINVSRQPVYYVVGSGLGQIRSSVGEVWGMGFLREGASMSRKPRRIHAVRGPLSAKRLADLGVPEPRVWGDPAALMPLLYAPQITPMHELGIVCHFREKEAIGEMMSHFLGDYKAIDIEGGLKPVVDEIRSCRLIASSSLHGLILADAYGIPSLWIRITRQPLGDGFKFRDYFSSVGRPASEPLNVSEIHAIQDVEERAWRGEYKLDLERLLAACPFWDRQPLTGRRYRGLHDTD